MGRGKVISSPHAPRRPSPFSVLPVGLQQQVSLLAGYLIQQLHSTFLRGWVGYDYSRLDSQSRGLGMSIELVVVVFIFGFLLNKLTSVFFHASVLLLITNFVITLSK